MPSSARHHLGTNLAPLSAEVNKKWVPPNQLHQYWAPNYTNPVALDFDQLIPERGLQLNTTARQCSTSIIHKLILGRLCTTLISQGFLRAALIQKLNP